MRWLLALALLLGVSLSRAETLSGVVAVVVDGDTILFKPDTYRAASRAFLRVRLAGIDAPEADQPHGVAATRALKDMALQQAVTLNVVGIDRYGRKLGRLFIGARSINAELVRRGHAWAWSRGVGEPLRALEDEARRAGIGLWQDPAPVAPWAWRRRT